MGCGERLQSSSVFRWQFPAGRQMKNVKFETAAAGG
jgi:hypothetical protein